MPIQNGHEGVIPLPFGNEGLIVYGHPNNNEHPLPKKDGTASTRIINSVWELLQFWFEQEDMPPRAVGKPNWNLIIAVGSMAITVLTMMGTGVWTMSQKNNSLDTLTTTVQGHSGDLQLMKLDIQELKDQNKQLLDEVRQMRQDIKGKPNAK